MRFQAPIALWALLALPFGAAVAWLVRRRRMKFAVRYTNMDVLRSVAAPIHSLRPIVPVSMYGLAVAALILGLARPQAMVSVPRRAATVILTIDVSGSMRAEDVDPTRLRAAQDAAATFLSRLPPRFRVGLVTFSDEANVLARPTTDRQLILDAIGRLEADGGTAMGDALAESVQLHREEHTAAESAGATAPAGRPTGAILLLSDGANTTGTVDPIDAAEQAREIGIPVFTVALGTPDGTLLAPDRFGVLRVVPVPPDRVTLRAIAQTTDALAFDAPNEDDLQRVYEDLSSRLGYVRRPREITSYFALGGFLLAGFGGALSLLWAGRFP